jgi:hypothetical protein
VNLPLPIEEENHPEFGGVPRPEPIADQYTVRLEWSRSFSSVQLIVWPGSTRMVSVVYDAPATGRALSRTPLPVLSRCEGKARTVVLSEVTMPRR